MRRWRQIVLVSLLLWIAAGLAGGASRGLDQVAVGQDARAARRRTARELLLIVPRDDFHASRAITWRPDEPPAWDDPRASESGRFFADEVDYFKEWRGDPSVGTIRHIRRLGIHPLGTHSPAVAKDSLMLALDEWSGGFPCVFYSPSLSAAGNEGSAWFGRSRVFSIRRAAFDARADRWLSEVVLDAPLTTFGVATIDGSRGHWVFQQYQHGTRRGNDGDWVPGAGPMANLPGGRSLIPGVMERLPQPGEADSDLYPRPEALAGWPLVGNGPLGLTSILRACHRRLLPFAEVPECLLDNPTLFDYGPDGRPRAFAANAYLQSGEADADGRYLGLRPGPLFLPPGAAELLPSSALVATADGEQALRPGYWVFRFDDRRPEVGWQLDPHSHLDIGMHVLNAVRDADGLALTSNWSDSTVSVVDLATMESRVLLRCQADPHAALGEPSGTTRTFVFLGNRAPYRGSAFGLDDGVFVHDIYLASAHPLELRDGRLIEPLVAEVYRAVIGRDPSLDEALADTARLRAGETQAALRATLIAGPACERALVQLSRALNGRPPFARELAAQREALLGGQSYEGLVRELAGL